LGAQKFFLLTGPCTSKISHPKILQGVGERFKIFPFLEVKCAIEQISETVGNINLLFASDC